MLLASLLELVQQDLRGRLCQATEHLRSSACRWFMQKPFSYGMMPANEQQMLTPVDALLESSQTLGSTTVNA